MQFIDFAFEAGEIQVIADAADFQPVRETFSVAEPSYDQIAAVEHANLARLVAEQKAELQTKSDRRREKLPAFRALLEKFEQSQAAKTRPSGSIPTVWKRWLVELEVIGTGGAKLAPPSVERVA